MATQVIQPTELSDIAITTMVPVDCNPYAVFLASKTSSTRYQYSLDLGQIVRLMGADDAFSFPWHKLRYKHTNRIRTLLTEYVSEKTGRPLAPVTINRMLSALKGILKTAWKLELIPDSDYFRAVNIDGIRGSSLPAGRELSTDEIAKLIGVCSSDPTPAGIRDQAIISVLYCTGARRAEIVALKLNDYDPATGKLKIFGKGRKERYAYVIDGAAKALADWLTIRGKDPGPLFIPIRKSGELMFRHLKPISLYGMLNKRGKQAGLDHFSPHAIRRLFVGDLLDAGADLATVSKLAGHTNIQTTLIYDRRREDSKKSAANLLHVPYPKRNGNKKE